MDPYKRFKLISNALSVAIVTLGVGLTTYAAGPADQLAASLFSLSSPEPMANLAAAGFMIGLVVLVWLSLAHYVLPRLFGFVAIRKLVLGRYYFEGTWVEAVRMPGDKNAIAIMDFQPIDDRFIVSGRFINECGETTANFRADFQDLQWPVVKLKHLQNRPDEKTGSREGVAEIMFEANRERAFRFDGCFIEGANEGAMVEGFRVDDKDAKRLRVQQDRMEVLAEYWQGFFNTEFQLDGGRSMRSRVEEARPGRSK